MTEAGRGNKPVMNPDEGSPRMPLFLFFSCKTSGSSFLRNKILDIAVHCWPYKDNAPVFYKRINHNGSGKGTKGNRSQKPTNGENHVPDKSSQDATPQAVCVFEELLQWIDSTVDEASSALGLVLYPVLIAHHGETFHFLFLFRMLENYNIVAMEHLEAHNVHFADPVPVLKQYKEARHTWLIDSRSLGLGSLLNDWFPAQFDETDLMHSRSRGALVVKLYTQCPLYWILYRIPIYSTKEWIEFYEEEKCYQEDKWELQENIPRSIISIQRKLTIKNLLKYGYNWSALLDLYKTCGSPQHFRQELRDMDIKSGAAAKITFTIVALKLEQDGSREYKVRIKSNMPYAKYYHLTDARGRHFILRVANVLPPCFFTSADFCDDRWHVPESLLQIGPPETWDAMIGCASNATEKSHSDKAPGHCGDKTEQGVVARLLNVPSSDSEGDWDDDTSAQDNLALENGEIPECFFKEATPAHVPTTLVTGVKVRNPFFSPNLEWTAVDPSDKETDSKTETDGQLPAMSSASRNQSNQHRTSASTNRVTPASLHPATSTNHKSSRSSKSRWTNQRDPARSGQSTSTNQVCCTANQRMSPAWTNQSDSALPHQCASTNQNSSSLTNSPKPHYYNSPNQGSHTTTSQCTSTRSGNLISANSKPPSRSDRSNSTNQMASSRSHHPTSTNHSSPPWPTDDKPSSRADRFNSTNQMASSRSHHPTSANHTSPPWPTDDDPSSRSHHSNSSNQMASSGSHHQTSANHSSPIVPSTPSSGPSRDNVIHDQGASPREKGCIPPRMQSKKKNVRKKTR